MVKGKGFNPGLLVIIYFCTSLFSFSYSASITPSYEWGRGLSVPEANLNLGGYLNSSFEHIGSQNIAALDDFSAFISWSPTARLHFFSELEIEDWLATDGGRNFNSAFKVERLYLDFLANEKTFLRTGKFLTPVGLWNVIHAAPLVWTTTRPLVTDEQFFPSHASGLMLNRKIDINEHNLDVSIYADDSSSLDPRKNEINFDNAFGGRINFEISKHAQLGASYLDFKRRSRFQLDRNHLIGVDMLWKNKGYELQIEINYRHANDLQGKEKGGYIQWVIPLTKQLYAVTRYEYLEGTKHFDGRYFHHSTNLGIVGLTWRPFVPLAIKAEYRLGSGNQIIAPDGVFTSLSLFF